VFIRVHARRSPVPPFVSLGPASWRRAATRAPYPAVPVSKELVQRRVMVRERRPVRSCLPWVSPRRG
jgi:hypothetical protein